MANQALTRRSKKHENTAKWRKMGVRILKKICNNRDPKINGKNESRGHSCREGRRHERAPLFRLITALVLSFSASGSSGSLVFGLSFVLLLSGGLLPRPRPVQALLISSQSRSDTYFMTPKSIRYLIQKVALLAAERSIAKATDASHMFRSDLRM